MTTDNDSRAIGRLEAQFESVQRQLEAVALAQKEALEESRDGRRRIYESQDAARKEATEIREAIKAINARIEQDAPTLSEIKKWKERFIGMQMLLGAGAAAIGGATVLFWKWISIKIGLA